MTIKEQILQLFEKNLDYSVKELVDYTGASKQMIHIALKQLIDSNEIIKIGKAPKTIYRKTTNEGHSTISETSVDFDQKTIDFMSDNFLNISAIGEIDYGLTGFRKWCDKRHQPFKKTVLEYISTLNKYKKYKEKNGLINGTKKLQNTYKNNCYLDQIYYLDFYAIERFGKTKLGVLLHYAKLGQNKYLMKELLKETEEKIKEFISEENFDAVSFVPPTIRRETQIMSYIENALNIPLPKVNIQKINGLIPIPQKSLNKIDDRIENARNSFAVIDRKRYNKVLLIDDAVGSGSTMNEIAGKIKDKNIANCVYGLAFVGSFKGFDVITDI